MSSHPVSIYVTCGIWIWGVVTVTLALGTLATVIVAGILYRPLNGRLRGAPTWFAGLYQALKENGSLVAGILGFSGLAWSVFFNAAYHS
jgi:hypothetical protein